MTQVTKLCEIAQPLLFFFSLLLEGLEEEEPFFLDDLPLWAFFEESASSLSAIRGEKGKGRHHAAISHVCRCWRLIYGPIK